MKIDLSIIIPLYNETESLEELSSWIHKVVQESKLKYEIPYASSSKIFVNLIKYLKK